MMRQKSEDSGVMFTPEAIDETIDYLKDRAEFEAEYPAPLLSQSATMAPPIMSPSMLEHIKNNDEELYGALNSEGARINKARKKYNEELCAWRAAFDDWRRSRKRLKDH